MTIQRFLQSRVAKDPTRLRNYLQRFYSAAKKAAESGPGACPAYLGAANELITLSQAAAAIGVAILTDSQLSTGRVQTKLQLIPRPSSGRQRADFGAGFAKSAEICGDAVAQSHSWQSLQLD